MSVMEAKGNARIRITAARTVCQFSPFGSTLMGAFLVLTSVPISPYFRSESALLVFRLLLLLPKSLFHMPGSDPVAARGAVFRTF